MEPTVTNERRVAYALIFVVLAAAAAVAFARPGLVRFWPFAVTDFLQLITPLFLVALFIEQAFSYSLRRAEERAGVRHLPLRGAHGFRRLVVNRGRRAGLSLEDVGRFVGHASVEETRGYERVGDPERQAAAATMAREVAL